MLMESKYRKIFDSIITAQCAINAAEKDLLNIWNKSGPIHINKQIQKLIKTAYLELDCSINAMEQAAITDEPEEEE